MRKILLIMIILTFNVSFAKIPFNKLRIKIKKTRYEGSEQDMKSIVKNKDKLSVLEMEQYIWVDMEQNGYLMIEEPVEGSKSQISKRGVLRYNNEEYNLDYDFHIALTGKGISPVLDNYTIDVPNYKFEGYAPKQTGKELMLCKDGNKRKVKWYRYSYYDPEDYAQFEVYKKDVNNSDMSESEKKDIIQESFDILKTTETKIMEAIWILDGEDTGVFLRKLEKTLNVMIVYDILEVEIEPNFDSGIFGETLDAFKVKEIK